MKAIALGAHGVLAGRATLWGAAVGGQAGASKALDIMKNELLTAMSNVGANKLSDLGPQLFARPGSNSAPFGGA